MNLNASCVKYISKSLRPLVEMLVLCVFECNHYIYYILLYYAIFIWMYNLQYLFQFGLLISRLKLEFEFKFFNAVSDFGIYWYISITFNMQCKYTLLSRYRVKCVGVTSHRLWMLWNFTLLDINFQLLGEFSHCPFLNHLICSRLWAEELITAEFNVLQPCRLHVNWPWYMEIHREQLSSSDPSQHKHINTPG